MPVPEKTLSVTHATGTPLAARSQDISEEAGLELLRRIQREKKGIKVHIEYLDIFGNEMEPVEFAFSEAPPSAATGTGSVSSALGVRSRHQAVKGHT